MDPIRFGLFRLENETYRLAPDAVPIEAFVNHLSDHDYVLSVHAMHVVRGALRRRVSDVWEIDTIFARRSAIALYHILSGDGERGFERESIACRAVCPEAVAAEEKGSAEAMIRPRPHLRCEPRGA